ncbi:MAG: ADP-ribosylglycohydrolase family protein [Candidatus Eisenbacteria bacterium]
MTDDITTRDRFHGALLGLACGDAVGTTVEFRPRGTFEPVTDMVGGGPFHLEPGQWTDDTSMALCLATSLVEKRRLDLQDQMERYVRWFDTGYLSSNGRCFDIGNATLSSLRRFEMTGDPLAGDRSPWSAGNGSLMRLAPVPLFYSYDPEKAERAAARSSRTTHGARECVHACRLFARILLAALRGEPKETCLFAQTGERALTPKIEAIARGRYRDVSAHDVQGTGYVVMSLEAALWSFWTTEDFESAILTAVNLGDDADTTAAVCGQIAGIYYGASGIPARWLERLAMRSEITALADRLHDAAAARRSR